MKLLDRYLQEVGFFLPKSQRKDILAELADDIRSQVDEQETALGRPLDEAEAEEILTRWGKPLLVAERYLPERSLIGPVLFPIYVWVLKIVALIYLLPWLLVWAALMLFSAAYRGDDPAARFSALWSWWAILLNCFFFVTVVFAYMERFTLPAWLAQEWNPHKPPAQSDPDQIPLASSLLGLAVNTLFAGWWLKLGLAAELWTAHNGDGQLTLATIWQTLYWPIVLLFLAGIALAGFNIARSHRTPTHAALDLARAIYALILIVVLVSTTTLVELTVDGTKSATEIANVTLWLNYSLRITLAIIGIAWAVDLYQNARRLMGSRR